MPALSGGATDATRQTYALEGTILEACSCNILCPCWVGEDPDNGTCDAILAYHIDRGEIRGADVSGLTWALVGHIPGNILEGNFTNVFFVNEEATPEQLQALTDAFRGRLGGALADLAALTGTDLGVYQVPIDYRIVDGEGTLTINGGNVRAVMKPYKSAYDVTTTLRDSIFSSIPGSPAWVGKAAELEVSLPAHGLEWSLRGTNAIQGQFRFEA